MVAKKRCDFCLKIKPDNLQTDQQVFNKEIKDVLLKISGMEVPSEQMSNILTCFDCAIGLLQAEPIVVKVRALLTRLSKQKLKKKTPAANGDISAIGNVTALEQSTIQGDNEDCQVATDDSVKNPEKIKARRKSVAKKLVDSLVNDELDGNPAASSTMAINANIMDNKSTPKPGAPKKQAKSNTTANNEVMPSPKKSAKARKISEKAGFNSQDEHAESVQTPKKDESTSPKNPNKRTISERSDYNSQNEPVQAFKKMKDPDEKKLNANPPTEPNGERGRQCMECGKLFNHLDRYEAHVLAQKCKLAAYECKHPDCMRRFFKLKKMLEHMQRKHPEMQDTEMD